MLMNSGAGKRQNISFESTSRNLTIKTSIFNHTTVNITTRDTDAEADAEAEATKEHVISGSSVLSSAPVNNY